MKKKIGVAVLISGVALLVVFANFLVLVGLLFIIAGTYPGWYDEKW